ncbi:MAG: hypothetical protein DHS20C18_47170 [Saprospiraceae bacterium]|nr:MAG: hypothetical protein DHS20C18_47170 [Saprospiraceae bacterium]
MKPNNQINMKNIKYETALKELQEIVEVLQEGTTSIDELSDKAKRASQLIDFCRNKLRQAEQDLDGLFGE